MPPSEEEEEEEEGFWSRPSVGTHRRHFEPDEEVEELDEPGQEDVLDAAGHIVRGAWHCTAQEQQSNEGLRARHRQPGFHGGALGQLFSDDGEFALGSERLPDRVRTRTNPVKSVLWRQACLTVLVIAGAFRAASNRRPSEESFKKLRQARYATPMNSTEADRGTSGGALDWFVLSDRSFEGRVAWTRYVDHGPVALATVALSVAIEAKTKEGKPAPKKVYEHRYLGLLGHWVPMPYLPQLGQRPGTFGVGACVLARCICVPAPARGREKAKRPRAPKGGGRCWRFRGGKSAVLNVMVIPNIVLFALWQWPRHWGVLSQHTTLSMANLSRGRLWALLAAPFSHRTWGEIFRSGVLLANAVDSFDRAGVSFATFLALYLGGCWAAWLARAVLWRRLIREDASAFYTQESGASGGLAAQLLFLARARPEDRFQFSLYFVPMPIELSAWQSLFAHGLLDVFMMRHSMPGEILAHLAAWAFGWAVYDAWSRHM